MSAFFKSKSNTLFFILACFFVGNALIAEFIGGKIFSLEETFGFRPLNLKLFGVEGLGFNLSAGAILWPIVFVITDIVNEYFGKKAVKVLSYVTIGIIIYAFFIVYASIGAVPNEWWAYESGMLNNGKEKIANMDLAYSRIMGQGLWIIVGSLIAFLVAQAVDVFVFHRIKKITGEKNIWLRATGSTMVSQLIDSFLVLTIAFYIGADWDIVRVLAIGTVSYIYKFSMAILLTPVIYFFHYLIDNYLGDNLSNDMKAAAMA